MAEVKKSVQGEKGLEELTKGCLEELIVETEEKKGNYEYYSQQLGTNPCLGNKRKFFYAAKEYYGLLVEKAEIELEQASKKLHINIKTILQYPLLIINNNSLIKSRKQNLEMVSDKLKYYVQKYDSLFENKRFQTHDPYASGCCVV